MQQLNTFLYGNSTVRLVSRGGEPWAVAMDVCHALGLENVGRAIGSLDRDQKAILNHKDLVELGLVMRNDLEITRLALVSEAGLYALIFKSQKLEAKNFRRWVTHVVLPSIRKTGGYQAAAPRAGTATLYEALALAAEAEKARAQQTPGLEVQPF